MTEYQPFRKGHWHGKIASDSLSLFPIDELDAWISQATANPVRSFPLRCISKCRLSDGTSAFVKVIRGLGDKEAPAWKDAIKWRFRSSRSLKVLHITEQLEESGFACPRILLAARKRTWSPWGLPTDLIVTREAPGSLVGALLVGLHGVKRIEDPQRTALLLRVGSELARLHCAGFVHGDAHPGNYFWVPGAEHFCYIDNDRTALHARYPLSGAIRNLVSAGFYLTRDRPGRISDAEWSSILDSYCAAAALPSAVEAKLREGVRRTLAKRLQRGY